MCRGERGDKGLPGVLRVDNNGVRGKDIVLTEDMVESSAGVRGGGCRAFSEKHA